jgi:hypothetical protein
MPLSIILLVEKVFKHHGLWDIKVSPPQVKVPPVTISIDYSDSQIPFSAPSFYPDPDYPMDCYRSFRPRRVITWLLSAIFPPFPGYGKRFDVFFIC